MSASSSPFVDYAGPGRGARVCCSEEIAPDTGGESAADSNQLLNKTVRPKVVAFGGGHGLAATLRALTHLDADITAVVTVADDGGSSGRLREEFGILPPGDLRMALSALTPEKLSVAADNLGADKNIDWARVLQHRYVSNGQINEHNLGNLLLLSLWQLTDSMQTGLDWISAQIGAKGRVLPMSLTPLEIKAEIKTATGKKRFITGQAKCAKAKGVQNVELLPADAPVHSEVIEAVENADYLILGPGSWYTSVIPHLIMPQLQAAILASKACKILCLNLEAQTGETEGYKAIDHIAAVKKVAPSLRFSYVLADEKRVENPEILRENIAYAQLILADLEIDENSAQHDPVKLARQLQKLFTG